MVTEILDANENTDLTGHFYYSEEAAKRKATSAPHVMYSFSGFGGTTCEYQPKPVRNFAELENGEIVEYTEWSTSGKPITRFDDLTYLGKGKYHHSENI